MCAQPSHTAIILFDGVCNLCNQSVRFIITHDKRGYFRFASLQTNLSQQLLKEHRLTMDTIDSVVLIEDGRAYIKSTAVLRIAKKLGNFLPLLYPLILVPRKLRDSLYDWVAKNRYRWFGSLQACMVPTPEIQSRFLNDAAQSQELVSFGKENTDKE